ncbi:hypothetical protein K501DRAFT_288616 [Backusella circina FSU 941]|nr:hypothetical protein K501DRAFT_288616 [Backusella circina FSU 941]
MAETKSHNNKLKETEEEHKIEQEHEQEVVVSSESDEKNEQVVEGEEIKEQAKPEQEEAIPDSTTATTAEVPQVQNPAPLETNLSGNGRILKEAFPDVEDDIIEAILQSQNGNVDSSFELLLGMSDPNYKPTPAPPPAPMEQDEAAPPMPPRPSANNNGWQNQASSVEEQLRMDEELAKKIYMQDEQRLQRHTSQQRQQQQQQQQQQRGQNNNNSEDDLFANFQEELPVIKEKMKEAGNAAKKKVMDLYNQFKANRNMNNQPSEATSSIPTTNAHYRGLPSDDGDDLLTGDVSALRLSDYDVYAQTAGGRTRKSNDFNEKNDGVIYVNPPGEQPPKTSTSDAQLRADEEFARQLAQEERRETRQTEQQQQPPPQMPARRSVTKPTVVIAPRSPLEMEGDSDYEDVGLTATASTKEKKEDNTTVPYVIGDDDDDSDSDDLVDVEEDEEHKSKTPQQSNIK